MRGNASLLPPDYTTLSLQKTGNARLLPPDYTTLYGLHTTPSRVT
jgi:hypothetical protein